MRELREKIDRLRQLVTDLTRDKHILGKRHAKAVLTVRIPGPVPICRRKRDEIRFTADLLGSAIPRKIVIDLPK